MLDGCFLYLRCRAWCSATACNGCSSAVRAWMETQHGHCGCCQRCNSCTFVTCVAPRLRRRLHRRHLACCLTSALLKPALTRRPRGWGFCWEAADPAGEIVCGSVSAPPPFALPALPGATACCFVGGVKSGTGASHPEGFSGLWAAQCSPGLLVRREICLWGPVSCFPALRCFPDLRSILPAASSLFLHRLLQVRLPCCWLSP